MSDVNEGNELERKELFPVFASCVTGYVIIMLVGRFVGGSIF